MSQKHLELLERRVVVLGANGSEKTSVISALLGQTGCEIAKSPVDCVRTTAEVNGRKFTYVDTPGWWRNYSAVDTAEYIKRKLVLSVLECPPGPHAFLLVVNSEALFGEQERKAVQQHVGLFGERIWEHIIVVFTNGEDQKTKNVEQYVEGGGEALKWLVSQCGNRYHMLHSFEKGSQNESSQLLAGIDKVVAKNTEPYLCEGRKLQDVEEKMRADQERAISRMDKRKGETWNRREMVHSSPELRIVLLGWLFSGKTFAKNTILSLKEAIHRGRTIRSKRSSGTADGRRISVVDTPGWFKYFPSQYLPDWVKAEIHAALTLDGQHPHAMLLTVPVDTTFQEGHRKVMEDNMKMFGEQVWRHTMVLFTCGDLLGNSSIEEHIESEGAPLQWLVEKCGNRYHVLSWSDEEDDVRELVKKIEEMVEVNSLFIIPSSKTGQTEVHKTVGEAATMAEEGVQWQMMDKAMEKEIKNIWDLIRIRLKSKDIVTDFQGGHPSLKNAELPNSPLSSSGIQSGQANLEEEISKKHADQLKIIRELLDRERARLDISVTARFHPMLSSKK